MFKRQSAPPGSALPPLLVSSVIVLGAHGGAGTTTVNRMLAPAAHEGSYEDWTRQLEPMVLVAKATAYGLRKATEAMTWVNHVIRSAPYQIAPPVLVLVADAPGGEPSTAKARARLVQDQVRGIVRIPYVPAWANLDDPLSVPAPRAVVTAASELRTLLTPTHQTPHQGVRA